MYTYFLYITKYFFYINIYPHNHLVRQIPLLYPFYRSGYRDTQCEEHRTPLEAFILKYK